MMFCQRYCLAHRRLQQLHSSHQYLLRTTAAHYRVPIDVLDFSLDNGRIGTGGSIPPHRLMMLRVLLIWSFPDQVVVTSSSPPLQPI